MPETLQSAAGSSARRTAGRERACCGSNPRTSLFPVFLVAGVDWQRETSICHGPVSDSMSP